MRRPSLALAQSRNAHPLPRRNRSRITRSSFHSLRGNNQGDRLPHRLAWRVAEDSLGPGVPCRMVPSSDLLMIASSADSTMAASRARSSSATLPRSNVEYEGHAFLVAPSNRTPR